MANFYNKFNNEYKNIRWTTRNHALSSKETRDKILCMLLLAKKETTSLYCIPPEILHIIFSNFGLILDNESERVLVRAESQTKFGRISRFVLPRFDLINGIQLEITLPSNKWSQDKGKWSWVQKIGFAIINGITLEIGGNYIDRIDGGWLNNWNNLTNNCTNEQIGNVPELTTLSENHDEYKLVIPLDFWFCLKDGKPLSIYALIYHQVVINIEFTELRKCICITDDAHIPDLWLDNVELAINYISPNKNISPTEYQHNEQEKRKFLESGFEQHIVQLQKNTNFFTSDYNNRNNTTNIHFNHPVKFMCWNIKQHKWTTGKQFFAYNPNVSTNKLREEATKRALLTYGKLTDIGPTKILTIVDNDDNDITGILTENNIDDATIDNIIIDNKNMLSLKNCSLPINEFTNLHTKRNEQYETKNFVTVYSHFNYGLHIDNSENPMRFCSLTTDSSNIIFEGDQNYFNYVQPYQHFNVVPQDGINVYSFALNPKEAQPSGSLNFSRMDRVRLNLSLKENCGDADIIVYAYNMNIFLTRSGMAGQYYSS